MSGNNQKNIKLRVETLPIIGTATVSYWNYKNRKNLQKKTLWEQYVKEKNLENELKKLRFKQDLLNLEIYIMSEKTDEAMFQEMKGKVLNNEMINEPEYAEFKKWVEGIDSKEKDHERIKMIIDETIL